MRAGSGRQSVAIHVPGPLHGSGTSGAGAPEECVRAAGWRTALQRDYHATGMGILVAGMVAFGYLLHTDKAAQHNAPGKHVSDEQDILAQASESSLLEPSDGVPSHRCAFAT